MSLTTEVQNLEYNVETRPFIVGQTVHKNLSPASLTRYALARGEGRLSDQQVLVIDTGRFTGRSPKDRFIVKDQMTIGKIWWGEVNIPFRPVAFDLLYAKMIAYLENSELFLRDAWAGAEENTRVSLRVITEKAYQSLFAYNMFIRPGAEFPERPEWLILAIQALWPTR